MLRPLVAVFVGSVLVTGLFAQAPAPKIEFPAPSPAASLKQRVGLTDISIDYSRPSMRGRKIFGTPQPAGGVFYLQPYGEVWRTGANEATRITFSTPVKFGGADVPAGTYGLFSIPGETEWTVILNKVPGQWGAYRYDDKNDLVRVKAVPQRLPLPVETFTIGFSDLSKESSAVLYLYWENVRVPVAIEVDLVGTLVPQIEAAMAAPEGKKPYFSAAMFYLDNNLDLKKAAAWMDAALAEQAKPPYYMIYRKGLILEKLGDKAGAAAAANQSLALARQDANLAGAEYSRLNEALLARLK